MWFTVKKISNPLRKYILNYANEEITFLRVLI